MALEKLDSQAVKQRAKWRATHRRKDEGVRQPAGVSGRSPSSQPRSSGRRANPPAKRVFRVNGAGRRKPMTLDEALLEMDQNRDYLVYRDADRDAEREGLSVLVRRRDGHFDLIES